MANRADLQALIERVEKATESDRELDVDIAWAIEPDRYRSAYWNGRLGKPGTTLPLKLDGLGRTSVRSNCPALTASVDAALALMERALPGTEYEITTLYGVAQVSLPLNDSNGDVQYARREDCNVCLAIIAATLRAMQQENE